MKAMAKRTHTLYTATMTQRYARYLYSTERKAQKDAAASMLPAVVLSQKKTRKLSLKMPQHPQNIISLQVACCIQNCSLLLAEQQVKKSLTKTVIKCKRLALLSPNNYKTTSNWWHQTDEAQN